MEQLTAKQKKAITELMNGSNVTETAAAVGVHRSTVYNYLKNPAVKKALRAEGDTIYTEAFARLTGRIPRLLDALFELGETPNPNRVRLDAIKTLLDFATRFKGYDIDDRLIALEQSIELESQQRPILSCSSETDEDEEDF